MIRTTKHSILFANTGKLDLKENFRIACAYAVQSYINYFWNTPLKWNSKSKNKKTGIETITNHLFDPDINIWDCPSMYSTVDIPIPDICSDLSARALKCCATQALGIIKGVTIKYHKRQWMVKRHQGSGTNKIRKLQSFIDTHIPTKPSIDIDNFKIELNSICCKLEESESSFDGYITLSGLGKKYGKILIPIKYTERSNYWKSKGKIKKSFLVGKDNIEIRWDISTPTNTSEIIVGADGGQNTCLTLSNGIATTKDIHGYDLKSINNKMARKKSESNGFKRACDHQTNYINWSVKQVISDIKEIRIESNKNIKKGRKTSKSLTHWSWPQIYKAVTLNCEEQGVLVSLRDSPYKSQRCSCCGYTHKNNRNKLLFRCLDCGFTCNSDMNSALNNVQDLCFISRSFMALKLNKIGFYWNEDGLFDVNGEAFTVPLGKNNDFLCNVSNY